MHAFNSSTGEAELGGSELGGLPDRHIEFQDSKQDWSSFYNDMAYLNRDDLIPLVISLSGVVLVFC